MADWLFLLRLGGLLGGHVVLAMTPKQNERYLKRMRGKALAEFYSQSVGMQWMVAQAIKKAIEAPLERLKRR